MPRYKRAPENRGLPARWQFTHGAYYYRVPPGLETLWDGKKRFLLGKTLPDAYTTWADRLGDVEKGHTVGALLDVYALKVIPLKPPKTRAENTRAVVNLKKRFHHFALEGAKGVKPKHVYQYVTWRSEKYWAVILDSEEIKTPDNKPYEHNGEIHKPKLRGGKTAAHREIEVLSHAFTKAVEWGWIDRHPFKGEVRLEGEPARTHYVEDWEIIEALSLKPFRKKGSVAMIQAYIRLKLLTGIARSDMLRLRLGEHLRDDGVHVTRHKTKDSTGKTTIYDYAKVPERREAVEQAKRSRPVDISPFLFCNKRGQGYFNEKTGLANGWDSMWQRFMDRVLAETKVTVRFTEHDLRGKVGSDAESLEKARALLTHADTRTTARSYRRKPERV